MKLKLLFYACPVFALLSACADDSSDVAPKAAATLQTTLAAGEWEVASYVDSHPKPPLVEDQGNPQDKEDLNDLPNYSFSFKPKDLIIATAYGTTDPVGLWITASNAAGEETLDMNYPYGPLDGLNGNWTVTQHTDDQISLKLHDQVFGGDDLIVFRKISEGTPDDNN